MSGTIKASKASGGKYMQHGHTVTHQNRTQQGKGEAKINNV